MILWQFCKCQAPICFGKKTVTSLHRSSRTLFWTIFENEDLQYTFTEHYDQNVRVPGVLLLRQLRRKCFVQKFQMSLTSISKGKDEMNNIKWIIRLALLEYWNEIFKTFQLFKNSSKSKKVKKKLKTIF